MLETGCFESDSDLVAKIVKEIIIGTSHLNIFGLASVIAHILAVSVYMLCIKQKRFYKILCVRK